MKNFSELVDENWSNAVFKASDEIEKYITDVRGCLKSTNAEIRSAAIAVLNEANISEAHDEIVKLIDDENPRVVEEVLEYLNDFCLPSDAKLLANLLRSKKHLFLASHALNSLVKDSGPSIDEEDPETIIQADINKWMEILRQHGYIA